MISINLKIKENAYDKIMYLLSHLKDDVQIINNQHNKDVSVDKLKQISILDKLSTLDRLVAQSNNKVMATKEIAIDTDGMSNDLS